MGVYHARLAVADVGAWVVDKGQDVEVADRIRRALEAAAVADQSPVPDFRGLLIGPIPQLTNGGVTYVFSIDGSKGGWPLSEAVHTCRLQFMADFESIGAHVALVEFGDYIDPPRASAP